MLLPVEKIFGVLYLKLLTHANDNVDGIFGFYELLDLKGELHVLATMSSVDTDVLRMCGLVTFCGQAPCSFVVTS